MIIKYSIAVCLCVVPSCTMHCAEYAVTGLAELLVIAVLTEQIIQKYLVLGRIFNSVTLFLLLGQMTVLLFGRSFISMSMLTNLASIKALNGKMPIYLSVVFCAALSAFIPHMSLEIRSISKHSLAAVITSFVCLLFSIILTGAEYSPCCNTVKVTGNCISLVKTQKNVERMDSSGFEDLFYQERIADGIKKPKGLPQKPNVILIFVEGLSKNVIDDDRMIMPNLKEFEGKALSFSGYYNHTFATYMGLIGQLYSGYQMNNLDENKLVSIQEILSGKGYHTAFINTEPLNEDFTAYLNRMGFDEVLSLEDKVNKDIEYISDKDAYELLKTYYADQIKDKSPLFLSMYSFGTHVSLDSPDEKFGDGSSNTLNRFYNVDVQLGKFLEWFENSTETDDTILVITSDHASYADDDFNKAFPNVTRESTVLDTIPLYIYHKKVNHQDVDAEGRNSLDLAPTLLDYLDISDENYFLGTSLFTEAEQESYDTVFETTDHILTTENKSIQPLDSDRMLHFNETLQKYYAFKLNKRQEEYVSMEFSDDGSTLYISFSSDGEYEKVKFPIWGEENGQNDLVWYEASKDDDGNWQCAVPIKEHNETGIFKLHIYGIKEKDDQYGEFITSSIFVVDKAG